jgi:hypothetical protein
MRGSNLKLVTPDQPGLPGGSPAQSTSAHPRPWRTFYYTPRSAIHEWSRIGRAGSLKGAIRAAVRHLLDGPVTQARVCDEDGLERATVLRKGNRITIVGGW